MDTVDLKQRTGLWTMRWTQAQYPQISQADIEYTFAFSLFDILADQRSYVVTRRPTVLDPITNETVIEVLVVLRHPYDAEDGDYVEDQVLHDLTGKQIVYLPPPPPQRTATLRRDAAWWEFRRCEYGWKRIQ